MAHDELTQMKLDINELKGETRHISEKLEEIHADFKSYVKESDTRFAGKWTEKVLVFVGTTVGLAVIGAIMTLILK